MAKPPKGTEMDRTVGRRMPPISPRAIWYLFLVLVVLWLWQDALCQAALRTIPYSEFKARLVRRGLRVHYRTRRDRR